ncbi:hypothetical protein HK102_001905 [Quaeritorhiza haematococci]|nr:hypothetical protein HK102_001905 [Quaeritorhiza haematococci]
MSVQLAELALVDLTSFTPDKVDRVRSLLEPAFTTEQNSLTPKTAQNGSLRSKASTAVTNTSVSGATRRSALKMQATSSSDIRKTTSKRTAVAEIEGNTSHSAQVLGSLAWQLLNHSSSVLSTAVRSPPAHAAENQVVKSQGVHTKSPEKTRDIDTESCQKRPARRERCKAANSRTDVPSKKRPLRSATSALNIGVKKSSVVGSREMKTKEEVSRKPSVVETWLNLTEISLLALKALAVFETDVRLNPYDLEKAATNLVTKLIDAGAHEQALRILSFLHARLSTPQEQDQNPTESKAKVVRSRIPRPSVKSEKAAPPIKTPATTTTETRDLYSIPASSRNSTLPVMSIVVAYLYSLVIKEMVFREDGAYDWKVRVAPEVGKPAATEISATEALVITSGWSSEASLALRSCGLKFLMDFGNIDGEVAADYALKFALSFEKAGPSSKELSVEGTVHQLLEFYAHIFPSFERLEKYTLGSESKFLLLFEHYLKSCKKLNKIDDIARAHRVLCKIAQRPGRRDVPLAKFHILCSAIDRFMFSFRGSDDDELRKESQQICSYALDCKEHFSDGTLSERSRSALESTTEALLDLSATMYACEKSDPEKRDNFRILSSGVVTCYHMLARVAFEGSVEQHSDGRVLAYLERAATTCEEFGFHDGIRWTSTAFYNHGGMYMKQSHFRQSLQFFERASALLQSFLEVRAYQEDQSDLQLQLSKRYEACYTCAMALGEFERALRAIQSAILQFPTEQFMALSGSESGDRESVQKLIRSYVKAALEHDATTYPHLLSWLKTKRPELDRLMCDVGELELAALRSFQSKVDTLRHQMDVAQDLVALYEQTKHPIKKAKMLLEQVQAILCVEAESVEGSLGSNMTQLCEEAISLLEADTFHDDELIAHTKEDLVATCHLLHGLCKNKFGEYDPQPLKVALDKWKSLVHDFRLYRANSSQLPTPHGILAEYFELLNQPLNRVKALELLLRLLNLKGTTSRRDSSEEAIKLYIQLCTTYLALDSTKQAESVLTEARAIIKADGCQKDGVFHWKLAYAHLLCASGDLENSQRVFDSALKFADANALLTSDRSWTSADILLGSLAHSIRGMIAFALGSLPEASNAGEYCLRMLSKAVKGAKRTVDYPEWGLLGSSWHITQKLLQCYSWLGKIYTVRGSVAEAERLCRKGLELAKSVKSPIYIGEFLLYLADVDCKRRQLEQSADNIKEADRLLDMTKDDSTAKNLALTKLRKGDQLFHQQMYIPAFQNYCEAEDLLKDSQQSAITDLLRKSPSARQSSPQSKKTSAQTLWSDLKLQTTSRIGLALNKQGKVSQAEKKLVEPQHISRVSLEQAEYVAALARLKLEKLWKNFGPSQSIIHESVLSLPSGAPPVSSSSSLTKTQQREMARIVSSVRYIEQLFKSAYEPCYRYGTPELFHEICHGLVLVKLMKAYLCPGLDTGSMNDVALECSFFLEAAKALTVKREYLALLHTKRMSNNQQRTSRSVMALRLPDRIGTEDSDHESDIESTQEANEESTIENAKLSRPADDFFALLSNEAKWSPLDFRSNVLACLPSTWVVCSISVDLEREDLYIVRYDDPKYHPTVVRLPMKRQALREGETDGVGYQKVFAELEEILDASNAVTERGKNYRSKDEKSTWWKERKALDTRMRNLLSQVESTWLGGFKKLLSLHSSRAFPEKALNGFRTGIQSLLSRIMPKRGKQGSIELDMDVCRTLVLIGENPSRSEIEDLLYYVMDLCQFHSISVEYDELDMDNLIDEFEEALLSFYETVRSCRTQEETEMKDHMVLILDKHLQRFPWENLPVLREPQTPISRMPSIYFLRDRIMQMSRVTDSGLAAIEVDSSSLHYVLNPDGDLANTQKEFESLFSSQSGWSGIIGRPPAEDEYEKGLRDHELFVYFGHGGGEQYISSKRIRNLDRCAVTMLMGCSSASLKNCGEFDPQGTIVNYLLNGCPAVVGNLWDVTDKDIDRFSKAAFDEWGLFGPGDDGSERDEEGSLDSSGQGRVSLVQAVAKARDACIMKFLVGAAPVVYGVPVVIKGRQ